MTWSCSLVATDLSPESERVADACLELPGPPRLLLVHVGTPTPSLEAEAVRLRTRGAAVEVQAVARHGRTVARTIIDTAAEAGVDLIAIGARGLGRAVDRLIGSVSEEVVRSAATDLLVVRSGTRGSLLARPLVATDLSPASIETARRFRAADGSGTGALLYIGNVVGDAPPAAFASLAAELGLEPMASRGVTVPAIIEAALGVRATVIVMSRNAAGGAVMPNERGGLAEGVALAAPCPVLLLYPHTAPVVVVREMYSDEFPLADAVWRDYHGTRGDPAVDRIFGLFVDGILASLARCRHHPDGFEVDAVFTPVQFRNRGYARRVVAGLVEACHNEELYMYAVAGLEMLYGSFGFMCIPEAKLPPSVRTRYEWASGDLEAAEVTPMVRPSGWYAPEG